MKAPIKCPVCGGPLLNIFPPAEDLNDKVSKYCNNKLSHSIAMICENEEVSSLSLGWDRESQMQITWLYSLKEIWIMNMGDKEKPVTTLPWFEPNFSNYSKLVNKIKTYLVFS